MKKKPATSSKRSCYSYVSNIIKRERLPVNKKSLVIMDVLKGQVTPMM